MFLQEDWVVNIDILKRQSLVTEKEGRFSLSVLHMNKYVEWRALEGSVQSDEVDKLLIDHFTAVCRSLFADTKTSLEELQ